jgi:hypothetical protein
MQSLTIFQELARTDKNFPPIKQAAQQSQVFVPRFAARKLRRRATPRYTFPTADLRSAGTLLAPWKVFTVLGCIVFGGTTM